MTDLFDAADLTDHELGNVEFVMNSPAWSDFFDPYLRAIREGAIAHLIHPDARTRDAQSDDTLRGVISTIDGFLAFSNRIINETSFERIARYREQSNEDRYNSKVADGTIAGGVDNTALVSEDPDEY